MIHRFLLQLEHLHNYMHSLLFCIRYFPILKAVKCPIYMHYKTRTYVSKNAKIVVRGGKIRIGVHPGSYSFNIRPTRFCVFDDSEVVFLGDCNISRGTNITVRYGGKLVVGNSFFCNADCSILVNKEVVFEDNALLGWDVTVLDSDGHATVDDCGYENTFVKPVHIGKHTWLGAKTTILKGVVLAENTIVPYGTVVYKSNMVPNVVFANKVIKRDVKRNE